jgi:hypothetical protein
VIDGLDTTTDSQTNFHSSGCEPLPHLGFLLRYRLVDISLVVIPVFGMLAGVLTYVFIGLQRNRNQGRSPSE